MKRTRIWCIRPPALAVVLASIALVGCADVRLYDKSKADLAGSIKDKYATSDILGTIDVQKKNLNALLAEEIKVVRENYQLQVDFALLELADNDSPMAETWEAEVELPMGRLGFTTGKELRDFSAGLAKAAVRDRALAGLRKRIRKRIKVFPPPCGPDMGPLPIPEGVDADIAERANQTYERYKEACGKKAEALEAIQFGGQLSRAKAEWENAQEQQRQKENALRKAGEQVKNAAEAHGQAVAAAMAAGATGDEVRAAIKDAADKIRSGLEQAESISPEALAEAMAEARLSSIVALLRAAAGEQVDVENDPELAKAVVLVGGLASLSGDIAQLVATARAPSVRNLLIELQHQTVLLEHAKALRTLQRQRVDILEIKYSAYLKEANLLLDFRDALCSFAFRHAGERHPGAKCDEFEVETDDVTRKVTCTAGAARIEDDAGVCALAKPWKEFLKTAPREEAAARELYKALAAYTQMFPVRASQIEQDFHLIDLQHRENLATREMALKAWNNLAAVPIEQLDAYYQSGLKPEAIADLIVKALGFTAITVGVSQ